MKERAFCELSLKHHQRVECHVDSSLILTMQCHTLKPPQSSDKSQLFNYKRLTCCSYTRRENKKKTCMFGTLRSLQPLVSSSPDVRLTDFEQQHTHTHKQNISELHANVETEVFQLLFTMAISHRIISEDVKCTLSFSLCISTSANKLEIKKDRHH